jgi:hypothetical protein
VRESQLRVGSFSLLPAALVSAFSQLRCRRAALVQDVVLFE